MSTMDDDAVRTEPPSTARRWSPFGIFLLMGLLGFFGSILVFEFAGQLWGFVVWGVLLALGLIFMCNYRSKITSLGSVQPTVTTQQQQQVNGGGVGLSQRDIEAITTFEYSAAAAAGGGGGLSGPSSSSSSSVEECSVCISAMRNGETVRRMPACGHAFHARCINEWLRGHATCPICRAGIKGAGDGEPPSPVAAAV